ncbi:hypothetical protein NVP1152O_094 [Vibrio phage 1.152.O._10N.222.46.E1]|uniref:Uncharacterized protein n=5 Tax=Nahantvirus 49C7 TaxID=2846601 RepID=A0A2I7RBG5_9CAUD|nr:hypothetical protein HYP57_gp092 [Vibrio phage 1.026.O._10N.222.49.C7]AUR82576.1 hypothetical protein NVP1025O_093 [Vibrio phage 1.025.O._10N.222.46.B6]AUR90826.1 hypothetical protein NVP1150O_093 [Vibrio phage 1.150.O._10N.222.46.A6]AUR90999.1 hypothetical protein NVP1152O_094 [Vibrio phage 1.152.O._10N.222.46.E1]AUS02467.1 hypothetical protein NVP2130O_093 [Vibrio phage 2.130.O._10N.222.46.C2]AUR82684.1 hypothetical protein NVP1026O_093 [Vibrio phage 1.026.O._10N.222.49.C7]
MDSRIPALIELLELNGRGKLCRILACKDVECSKCPFNGEKDFDDLIDLLNTYELLES